MSFSQENGYVPVDVPTIMDSIMEYINIQFGTSYVTETFVGTNHYKFFYAAAQKIEENEIKTSEIFLKLQQYITEMNEMISRPVTTAPGTIDFLEAQGFISSTKPPADADAGKRFICVDVDEGLQAKGTITITSYANLVSGTDDVVTVGATGFTAQVGTATPGTGTFQAASSNNATATSLAAQINAHAVASTLVRAIANGAVVHIYALQGGTAGNSIALGYTDNDTNVGATKSGTVLAGGTANADYADLKEEICTLISQITAGGIVTQGTESESIVISNGQSFDFKYYLPNRLRVGLKLTVTTSENNQLVIDIPDEQKAQLIANIVERYRLGKNFEPQRYYSVVDAPWASNVLLEWTTDVDAEGEVVTGATYHSTVYDADYRDLFVIDLARILLVEN